MIFFPARSRFFPDLMKFARTLPSRVRELLLLQQLLCREKNTTPSPADRIIRDVERKNSTNEHTHPCIARLRISPILSIRRRRFPKTPRRPTLSRRWTRRRLTRPSSRRRRCVSVPSFAKVVINTLSLSLYSVREGARALANEVTFDRGQTKLVSKCFFLCLGFRV